MLVSLVLALLGVGMVAAACVMSPALLLFMGGTVLVLVGILRDEDKDKGGSQ